MAIIDLTTVKTLLRISSDVDDAIIEMMIPVVEEDYLRIHGKAFDVDEIGEVIYPVTASVCAAEMIRWKLESKYGYQSESLGDRSYQKEEQSMGYPRSIISMIDQYVRTF